jgi:hypothetical protein
MLLFRGCCADWLRVLRGLLPVVILFVVANCTTERGADLEVYTAPAQSDVPAGYAFALQAPGQAIARCPAQRIRATLGPQGLEVASVSNAGAWSLRLETVAIGRGEKLESLPNPSNLDLVGNRARVKRGAGVEEWYRSERRGIEHGFVIAEPPDGFGRVEGELVLKVVVSGLQPALSADHTSVALKAPDGRIALHYSELSASDAIGRRLRARLEVEGEAIRLVIDDRAARYPLQIDPLIWVEMQKLTPPGDAYGFNFGRSVGIDGDTAVVGALGEDGADAPAGAAYVYVRSGSAWAEQQKLVPGDGAADDGFGSAAALNGDTAVVAAPFDDDKGTNSGSAYVFVRVGSTWTLQQKLVASDGAAGDEFGRMSIALFGDTVLVGAYGDGDMGAYSGSVYVFTRTGSVWAQQQKLTASDGTAYHWFGQSVSLYADTALIGAYGDDEKATDAGAAYVFVRTGTTWTLQRKLTAGDSIPSLNFGSAVALSGDTALIGANRDDDKGSSSGSAYVFLRQSGAWSLQQKLVASDGVDNDYFGTSVALYGDRAVVGSYDDDKGENSGSAYVYLRQSGSWGEQQKIVASDGATGDYFGTSLAMSASRVLVGVPQDDDRGENGGSAYVFEDSGSGFTQQTKIMPTGVGAKQYNFGESVSLQGDTALVGGTRQTWRKGGVHVVVRSGNTWSVQAEIPQIEGDGNTRFGGSVSLFGDTALVGACEGSLGEVGSAYVYVRSGSAWTLQKKLTASDGVTIDMFGWATSLYADTALIGAFRDDNYKGSAYVFVRSGSTWSEQQKLTPSDGVAPDEFGGAVSVYVDTALIGSTGSNGHAGAAYVFVRSGSTWIEQQKLTAAGASYLGLSVSLHADTALVGAGNGAYVFVRSGSSWSQQQKLVASDGVAGDDFGRSVSLYGDVAIVGAERNSDKGQYAGAAYLYVRSGTNWTQQSKLLASDGAEWDYFGASVSLYDNLALIGAPNTDDKGQDSGSAYLFQYGNATGDPCSTWDQCGSAHCADGVCCNSDCTGICMACTTAKTGKPTGQCSLIPLGSNPDGECSAGTCNGAGSCNPCGNPGECKSGHCVDSVCCASACAATCSACAQTKTGVPDGQCGFIPLGSDPDNECGSGSEQSCDGAGTCRKELGLGCSGAANCFSNQCVDGVCCATACSSLCSACTAAKTDGTNGTCGFVSAGTDPDSECGTGPDQSCDGTGQCRKHNGQVCSTSLECLTGFCVDGVCCDKACGALCVACVQSKTAVADGQCQAIPLGQDPDEECAGDLGCHVEGQCQVALGLGCSHDDECKSVHCVDGVCCDTACGDACDVCSVVLGAASDGTCAPAPVSSPGSPSCTPFACNNKITICPISCASDAHCAGGHYCASGSACQPQKGQGAICNSAAGADCLEPGCRVCATGQCVDGYCCDTPCSGPCDVCSGALGAAGDGTCSPAPAGSHGIPSCSPYVCTGAAADCGASCANDTQCAVGFWCESATQTCKPPQANGASCSAGSQCQSGACADDVCCDTSCTAPCRACAASLKQSGVDSGTCGEAKDATDPHDRCPDEGAVGCKGDGLCNASGACRYYAAGTPCGSGSLCAGNVAKALSCDGLGKCTENQGTECAPGKCVEGACTTTCAVGTDCSTGAWCKNGTCTDKSSQGQSCTSSEECAPASAFCVDGFCCNAPCTGQCEACDVDQGHGSCVPVSGKPHNSRPACSAATADNICAEATCDGTVRDSCVGFVAGPTYVCRPASCATGVEVFQATCIGKGNCPDLENKACAPYVCDTAKCKDTCTTVQDCSTGNQCDPTTHQCVGIGAVCDGEHTLTSTNGSPKDCSPYKCSTSNACLNACTSRADCVGGMSCTAEGRCEPAPEADAADAAGCGCRLAGHGAPGTAALGAIAGLLLAVGVAWRQRARR